jgi:Icc-related predicted phosphoesterase
VYLDKTGSDSVPSAKLFSNRFNFSTVAGSSLLQQQIDSLRPKVHCCGHGHRKFDFEIGGCRYVNNPIGYPQERDHGELLSPFEPLKVWGREDVL